jgi:tetratricopeptide (TPR) repeat protein
MSIKLANNFLIDPSFKLPAGFYQQLIGGMTSFQELGNRLVKITEQAQTFRQYDKVKEAAQILANIPIKQYQAIGHYYMGLCEFRRGKSPRDIFEQVAEYAPAKYRALAMHSLAAIEARKQDYESELYWFVESLKVHPSVEAFRDIAVIRAKEGYHQSAVKDLEKLYPLIRYVDPLTYYQYLNSLAVELGAVGRKYEARNIIRYVLASPYAFAYPEWRDTAEELKEPNRSFIVIDPSPARMGKLLSMPEFEHAESAKQDRPASVINLQMWKAKMGKDKNGEIPEIPKDMNVADMMIMVMNLMSKEGNATEEKMRKLVEYATKLFSEKKDK